MGPEFQMIWRCGLHVGKICIFSRCQTIAGYEGFIGVASPSQTNHPTESQASDAASAAKPTAASTPVNQKVELPQSEDRLRVWGLLVLCMLAVLPAMLISLDRFDTNYTMEKISLLSSQETWLRQHASDDPTEWLIPSWNGRPRVEKPPLTVWLNMAAWLTLAPEGSTPQQLVLYARWVAVGLSMVALLSVFWAGMSVGNLRTAALAMVVTGTCWLFIKYMRLANYDTHLTAFVTLAIAAGLWAMRPLKEVNWTQRRVLGWLVAGIAMGAAFMVKGFVAAPLMLVPLVAAIIVTPRRRFGNVFGLLFALLLGLLLAVPWFMYVVHIAEELGFATADDAIHEVFREYVLATPDGGQKESQPFWYYAGLFGLAFPWTVWLIGALFQPWMRAQGERRRHLLIAWLWFVGIFVILSIPGAKQQRYLLPILPAMGLLVGQLWAWHIDLANRGQSDHGSWVLWFSHWVMLLVASISIPLLVSMQDYLIARGSIEQYEVVGLPGWLIAVWGVALTVLALEGLRLHWKWHPRSSAVCSVIWIMVMSTVLLWGYVRSYHGTNPVRVEAEKVAQTLGDDPLFCLRIVPADREPNEEFLFYSRLVVPPVDAEGLAELAQQEQPVYVMIRVAPDNEALMRQHGFVKLYEFDDGGTKTGRSLYRSPVSTSNGTRS